MPTPKIRITLNDTQIEALRELGWTAPGRVSQRAHFVLMSHSGFSAAEIGRLMYVAENTVKKWLRAYQAQGTAGLTDQSRVGRPPVVKHLHDIVEAQITQSPDCFGYAQMIWTVVMLLMHLRERFRVRVSASTLSRALHALGYSWHRPKLYPASRPDPLDAERRAGLSAALINRSCHLLAVDECDMSLLAVLRGMWQRIGQQVRLPTPGQNAKVGVFGAVNLITGQLQAMCALNKRSIDYIAFLEQILLAYPTGRIKLIVDNGSIHKSAATCTWLALHPRLSCVFLPTYSGHLLNPIEKVWWLLKQHVAANRNYANLDQLIAAIQRWLTFEATPQAMLTLINSPVSRQAANARIPSAPRVNYF
jgi:putative transposase